MKGNSSKKKIIVAATLVGVVLLAAVISVVAVLAAATQTVQSSINVSYRLDDVAATVSARYYQPAESNAKINWATPTAPGEGETFELVDVDSTADGNEGVKFTTDDKKAGGAFTFPAITLSSTYDYVIFEYNFTNNLVDKAITVTLGAAPTPVNMTVYYAVSATRLDGNSAWEGAAFETVPEASTLVDALAAESSALTLAGGASVSVYIKVQVADLNKAADYNDGGFTWNLGLAA